MRGGLPAIEVTLRTQPALAAIERIAAEVQDAIVGAGTVTTTAQIAEALAAGARFLVSPGATPTLLDGLQASGVPFLPGTATASDLVALLERGITHAKLFPAEVVGGVKALKAFAGPFPQMRFCPTGGINAGQRAGLPRAAERRLRRRVMDGRRATSRRSRPKPPLSAHWSRSSPPAVFEPPAGSSQLGRALVMESPMNVNPSADAVLLVLGLRQRVHAAEHCQRRRLIPLGRGVCVHDHYLP